MSRVAILMSALLLGACMTPPPAADTAAPSNPIELRTWSMPEVQAKRIARSLNKVMPTEGETSVGRATQGPGDLLVVAAPASVLDSVDAIVQQVETAAPSPAPQNVQVEYWIIEGQPGEATPPPEPELGPAFEAIFKADGMQRLTLHERRVVLSQDGGRGRLADATVQVSNDTTVLPNSDRLALSVTLDLADPREGARGGPNIRTEIVTTSSEVTVLSQVGGQADGSSLYILVRPTLLP